MKKEFNLQQFIERWEDPGYDMPDEETIRGFQHMIDSGEVYQMGEAYRHFAQFLLDNDKCKRPVVQGVNYG